MMMMNDDDNDGGEDDELLHFVSSTNWQWRDGGDTVFEFKQMLLCLV
jgi:hypothetical protein